MAGGQRNIRAHREYNKVSALIAIMNHSSTIFHYSGRYSSRGPYSWCSDWHIATYHNIMPSIQMCSGCLVFFIILMEDNVLLCRISGSNGIDIYYYFVIWGYALAHWGHRYFLAQIEILRMLDEGTIDSQSWIGPPPFMPSPGISRSYWLTSSCKSAVDRHPGFDCTGPVSRAYLAWRHGQDSSRSSCSRRDCGLALHSQDGGLGSSICERMNQKARQTRTSYQPPASVTNSSSIAVRLRHIDAPPPCFLLLNRQAISSLSPPLTT